jgi:hypothetical protein
MATKTAPGRTRRESYSTPVMSASELPAEPMDATSEMRSGHFIPILIVDCTDDVGLEQSAFAADNDFGAGGHHGAGSGGLLARDAVACDLYFKAGAACLLDDLANGQADERGHA